MSSAGIFPSLNFPSRREERRHRHRDRPVRAGRQRGTGGWRREKLAQQSLRWAVEAEDIELYRYCCLKVILAETRFSFHLASAPRSAGKNKQRRKYSAIVRLMLCGVGCVGVEIWWQVSKGRNELEWLFLWWQGKCIILLYDGSVAGITCCKN